MLQNVSSRLAIALVVLLTTAAAFADPDQSIQSKINNQVLVETAEGKQASFIVFMSDQADLSSAYNIKDSDARGWYVYRTLRDHAEASQQSIRGALDEQGVRHTTFWAANMIVVEGGRDLVQAMASRSDVAAIEPNSVVGAIEDESGPESTDEGNEVEATEAGVTNVQGPGLWSSGFTGVGIVVANQDTGMRWTHAALRSHYRGQISGTTADHNYNWWDSVHARITNADGGTSSPATNSCGYNLQIPCDDQGHGTHTTGTTIGNDAGAGVGTGTNQIGVAYGAKWIGCRNMDAGNGRAATYTECFQFFLAPTNLQGQNADPTKRPHVMNNSWGCPQAGELCPPNVMKTIVENSEASGILVVVSNGNSGSACATTTDPPAIYEKAFSVGAISGSTNALQSFSSRGPVAADGSGRMKPDISAPGASVRSSLRTNDTSYGSMSGTSMAGPHVVGTVALLWSARPRLVRDAPRTKWLLTRAANPSVTVANNAAGCGGTGPIPNNHFGWGRVAVLTAANLESSLEQAITFPPVADKTLGDVDFALGAVATSNLPVSYAASGSCSVSGSTVHINTVGFCTLTGSQGGIDEYSIVANAPKPWYPAGDVSRTFNTAWPYSGFFSPITNTGLNSTQPGSSVPVKFTLGGDRGLAILAAGYPRSATISCTTGDVTGAFEEGTPPGNSSLHFDPLTNEYNWVWKTDKAWAGACRVLEVKFVDNTTHTAAFQFKK